MSVEGRVDYKSMFVVHETSLERMLRVEESTKWKEDDVHKVTNTNPTCNFSSLKTPPDTEPQLALKPPHKPPGKTTTSTRHNQLERQEIDW